jgi:hypothetical protein
MGDYLTDGELFELTGRRQSTRQVEWLARNDWLFAVTDLGRPRVARAYWARRLAGNTVVATGRVEPDFAALGSRV